MSNPPFIPPRPQTPQALLHRMPDKPESASGSGAGTPSKYVVLIMGSTGVAGKVQIAKELSGALKCPLFQAESLHESSAKAANLGTTRRPGGAGEEEPRPGPNEARYQRMWLSKMTRTGLLFPEESRPATEGFAGFGGASSSSSASASTSRRGSASSESSVASMASSAAASHASSVFGGAAALKSAGRAGPQHRPDNHNPVFTLSEQERARRANPALLVTTHPQLEQWHKTAIRTAVGEYGIGVIFVPLYEDGSRRDGDDDDNDNDDLPVLRPLNPATMATFTSFDALRSAARTTIPMASLEEEMVLRVDCDADVEAITEEIVQGAREIMGIKP